MDKEQETLLSTLAQRLLDLNNQIKIQNQLKDPEKIINEFIKTKDVLKEYLAESNPLDEIRNPILRDVFLKIRKGNYFELDKREARMRELIEKHGTEFLEALLGERGIKVTEKEIDKYLDEKELQFKEEMLHEIDFLEYFDRRERLGSIITMGKLPMTVHRYYPDIKKAYLFGQMYAALGLCRVILEICFKEKMKSIMPKLIVLENFTFGTIVDRVCDRLEKRDLRNPAKNLYKRSSDILHGGPHSTNLNPDEVLDFIHETFDVIEKLYS